MHGIKIDCLGGTRPAQGEGTVEGSPFYFRARGNRWSMSIGGTDVVGSPDWYYEEDYGDTPFAAGWMDEGAALCCIGKAIAMWRATRSAEEPADNP